MPQGALKLPFSVPIQSKLSNPHELPFHSLLPTTIAFGLKGQSFSTVAFLVQPLKLVEFNLMVFAVEHFNQPMKAMVHK